MILEHLVKAVSVQIRAFFSHFSSTTTVDTLMPEYLWTDVFLGWLSNQKLAVSFWRSWYYNVGSCISLNTLNKKHFIRITPSIGFKLYSRYCSDHPIWSAGRLLFIHTPNLWISIFLQLEHPNAQMWLFPMI